MGDRVSISFRKKIDTVYGPIVEESVALFSHWDGKEFVRRAKEYVEQLKERNSVERDVSYPLDRMEPRIVMVDFIRHLTKDMDEVVSNYYLGRDEEDGDNRDNGHYVIDLD